MECTASPIFLKKLLLASEVERTQSSRVKWQTLEFFQYPQKACVTFILLPLLHARLSDRVEPNLLHSLAIRRAV